MKTISSFLSIVIIVLISLNASAKIWRVNNMPGVIADFTTAQAAHNAAAAGDTIHLEPSTNSYGDVTSSKPLTWIGLGEYLSYNPGNQAGINATVGTFNLNAGSGGSKVTGMSISGYLYIYASDVVVQRNYVGGYLQINATGLSNCVITQNFVWYGISLSDCNNAIVMDNIMGYGVTNSASGQAIIKNNIMGTYSATGGNIYNSVFQNNILRGNSCNFTNSQVSYNLTSAASGIPVGNFNQFNVDMTTVFENDGLVYQGRVDKDYRLKAGSPAIGAGAAGVDCGAFAGEYPYVLALQPAIPAITALSSPAINNASSITVTFSAKSNQ